MFIELTLIIKIIY